MLLKSGLRHYFVLDTNASTARRRDPAVAKGAAQADAKQDW